MIPLFASLALLTVTDPAVGPTAADILAPPGSALYRNLAPFDLQEVAVLDQELIELRLQMGAYSNPLGLENGFSHPVIEIYLGGGEYGTAELLPGSGMILPDGETWTVALKLTGDLAQGWLVTEGGATEFEPQLQLIDDYLYVSTDIALWEDPRIAAMTGLYSPFHTTGWRPLESSPSPWAFSSSEQQVPVIDVLALDVEAQRSALSGGVLPVTEVNTIRNPNTLWLSLMAGGIAIAGVGLVLRGLARTTGRPVGAVGSEEPAQVPSGEAVPVTSEAVAAGPDTVELAVIPDAAEVTETDDVPVDLAPVQAAAVDSEAAAEDLEPEAGAKVADEFEDEQAPRVGIFRSEATELPAAGELGPVAESDLAPEAATEDENEYALPDYGRVDFGDFEDDFDDDFQADVPAAKQTDPAADTGSSTSADETEKSGATDS